AASSSTARRLCTRNASRALIECPYSREPQAVGAVYDRPGFFVQSPARPARQSDKSDRVRSNFPFEKIAGQRSESKEQLVSARFPKFPEQEHGVQMSGVIAEPVDMRVHLRGVLQNAEQLLENLQQLRRDFVLADDWSLDRR